MASLSSLREYKWKKTVSQSYLELHVKSLRKLQFIPIINHNPWRLTMCLRANLHLSLAQHYENMDGSSHTLPKSVCMDPKP